MSWTIALGFAPVLVALMVYAVFWRQPKRRLMYAVLGFLSFSGLFGQIYSVALDFFPLSDTVFTASRVALILAVGIGALLFMWTYRATRRSARTMV